MRKNRRFYLDPDKEAAMRFWEKASEEQDKRFRREEAPSNILWTIVLTVGISTAVAGSMHSFIPLLVGSVIEVLVIIYILR